MQTLAGQECCTCNPTPPQLLPPLSSQLAGGGGALIVISFLHFKVFFYKHMFLNKRKYLTVPPSGFFTLNTTNSLATQGVFSFFPFLFVCLFSVILAEGWMNLLKSFKSIPIYTFLKRLYSGCIRLN